MAQKPEEGDQGASGRERDPVDVALAEAEEDDEPLVASELGRIVRGIVEHGCGETRSFADVMAGMEAQRRQRAEHGGVLGMSDPLAEQDPHPPIPEPDRVEVALNAAEEDDGPLMEGDLESVIRGLDDDYQGRTFSFEEVFGEDRVWQPCRQDRPAISLAVHGFRPMAPAHLPLGTT